MKTKSNQKCSAPTLPKRSTALIQRSQKKNSLTKSTAKPKLRQTGDTESSGPKVEASPQQTIASQIERARKSGKWLIAIFYIENEKLFLDRIANSFLKADIDAAMRLIVEDVQKLKE